MRFTKSITSSAGLLPNLRCPPKPRSKSGSAGSVVIRLWVGWHESQADDSGVFDRGQNKCRPKTNKKYSLQAIDTNAIII